MIERHDEKQTGCPMLGHSVPFSYCRTMNDNLPCNRIFFCWHESMDIEAFIKEHYTKEEVVTFTTPPKTKIQHILSIVEKAKKSQTPE